ncbi:MAG: hypothetical protein Q7R30_11675 [Acidobacteriota bacterium]|nr:hypothetical protein [Acidobacteriota bacterium]
MRALALLLLVLSASAPAWAQDSEARPAPADQPTAIDATKLGVSLARIQKGLRVSESREKQSTTPLRIEFAVQVYGFAPRIDLLKDVDILHGDAPNSAPTHRQIIDFLTPQIYRQQAAPISALAWWAGLKLWEKSKKSKCEQEIADYRAMLMQGMNIAAPRCTQ